MLCDNHIAIGLKPLNADRQILYIMKSFTVLDQVNAINKHCVRNNMTVVSYEVSSNCVFANFADNSYITLISIIDLSIKTRLKLDIYDDSCVESIISLTA